MRKLHILSSTKKLSFFLFFLLLVSSSFSSFSKVTFRANNLQNKKAENEVGNQNHSKEQTEAKSNQKKRKVVRKAIRKRLKSKDESGFKVFLKLVLIPFFAIAGLVKLFTLLIGVKISLGALFLVSLGLYGVLALTLYVITLSALGNK